MTKNITAIIRNERVEWTEEFEVPDGKDAEEYIKSIVKSFNDTLRPHELPRKFVRLVKKEHIDFKKLTDNELIELYQKYLPKQVSVNRRKRFDEIAGEYSQKLSKAIEKKSLKQMYYLLNDYTEIIWDDAFREVIKEMQRRDWKNLKIRMRKKFESEKNE